MCLGGGRAATTTTWVAAVVVSAGGNTWIARDAGNTCWGLGRLLPSRRGEVNGPAKLRYPPLPTLPHTLRMHKQRALHSTTLLLNNIMQAIPASLRICLLHVKLFIRCVIINIEMHVLPSISFPCSQTALVLFNFIQKNNTTYVY